MHAQKFFKEFYTYHSDEKVPYLLNGMNRSIANDFSPLSTSKIKMK